METDAYNFTLLQNTTDEGPKFLLVLTFPDGRQIVRDCASEEEAERVYKETTHMIAEWYRGKFGDDSVSVREETVRGAPRLGAKEYLN